MTTSGTAERQRVIRAFVRGDGSWRDLEPLGIRVTFSDDGCEVEGHAPITAPTIGDIARGLLSLVRGPKSELQQWAAVLLAGSSFIDLSQLERQPQWDLLLSALWDASAGDPVPEQAIWVAETLANAA